MPQLPTLKPTQIITELKKLGFKQLRQKGSHIIMRHPDTKDKVVIPLHVKDMPKGTLHSILRQSKVNINEFLKAKG